MDEYQDEKLPPLTTVRNFRDVAGLVMGIKPGLLYRSAHIDDASREDLDILRERHKIRSVIDLRGMHPWPMISTVGLPAKHEFDYTQQYPDQIASTSILGLNLHYIGLAGPQFGRYIASQVGFWDKAKAFAEIAISPASGIKNWKKFINAKMSKGRMTVHEIIIDHSYPQIKAVFKVLADPSSYPVLILNQYGTDLVSLIVSLILFLLHADTESIHRDYMQTYEDLANPQSTFAPKLKAKCTKLRKKWFCWLLDPRFSNIGRGSFRGTTQRVQSVYAEWLLDPSEVATEAIYASMRRTDGHVSLVSA
ncbi:unnamed protein product [Aureobasidium uvarum]|uniref:Uncharacterized protein n=1 Tax=Aureobasidium uvarum TaxID=2773716 RepID=A0A9N8KYT2_9PEZI|nr:unnamed protein product [Aureobasidium uvarum]